MLDAAAKLRAAAAALGPARVALLRTVVVEDRSFRSIGQRLGLSHHTALQRVAEAIAALAAWMRGAPVAAPPPERYRNQPGRS